MQKWRHGETEIPPVLNLKISKVEFVWNFVLRICAINKSRATDSIAMRISQAAQAQLFPAAHICYCNRICPFKPGSVAEYTAYGQFHLTRLEDILNI